MDIAALSTTAADEGGIVFTAFHPKTLVKYPLHFTLRSANSEAARERANAYMQKLQTDKNYRKTGTLVIEGEDAFEQVTKKLTACIINWRDDTLEADVLEYEGERLPCTPKNIRRILGQHGYNWLREQLSEVIDDVGNFFTGDAPTSTPMPSASFPSLDPTTLKTPAPAA